MRRAIYESTDRAAMVALLDEAEHGFLGLVDAEGWPYVVPLNFVRVGERLYFHGATRGRKMEALAHDPRVWFTVVDAASLVPSYFMDERSACPATQYYRSVMVRGRARVVQDPHEKARALQALMEKLQPEGGHEPITADAELYSKPVRTTAVTAIEIEELTGKFKFGQNLPPAKRLEIARRLEERGGPKDHDTAARVRATIDGERRIEP